MVGLVNVGLIWAAHIRFVLAWLNWGWGWLARRGSRINRSGGVLKEIFCKPFEEHIVNYCTEHDILNRW